MFFVITISSKLPIQIAVTRADFTRTSATDPSVSRQSNSIPTKFLLSVSKEVLASKSEITVHTWVGCACSGNGKAFLICKCNGLQEKVTREPASWRVPGGRYVWRGREASQPGSAVALIRFPVIVLCIYMRRFDSRHLYLLYVLSDQPHEGSWAAIWLSTSGYEGKVKSSRPSLSVTQDKRWLGRDPVSPLHYLYDKAFMFAPRASATSKSVIWTPGQATEETSTPNKNCRRYGKNDERPTGTNTNNWMGDGETWK